MSAHTPPITYFLGNARTYEFERLREAGYRLGLIRDTTGRGPSALDSAFDAVIGWDPADGVAGLSRLLREAPHGEVAGVLNLREAYCEAYADLLTALGLPTLPRARVAALRSKAVMRSAFREHIGPDSTGLHARVREPADVVAFGARVGWPVILKPAALYSSLFVVTIDGPGDVARAFTKVTRGLADHVAAKGLPDRFRALQAEQFLPGSNHSVDVVLDRDGQAHPSPVVDVETGRDHGAHDFHHFARFAPSRLPDQQPMIKLALKAVEALGLRSGAAHVEFIQTSQGPRLLEVGLRPGGHRIRMLDQGYGVDFIGAYLAGQRGDPVDLGPRHPGRPFAIVTPFPARTGRFVGVRGLERVTMLPSYRGHHIFGRPGSPAGSAADGHWQVMSIELTHDDPAQVAADVKAIRAWDDLVLVDQTETGAAASADTLTGANL